MASRPKTYCGRVPTRSLGIHPPSGFAGENAPYPPLEVMLSLRTRLAAKLGTLAEGSYMATEYQNRIARLDAQIQQRRDMKKATP